MMIPVVNVIGRAGILTVGDGFTEAVGVMPSGQHWWFDLSLRRLGGWRDLGVNVGCNIWMSLITRLGAGKGGLGRVEP